MIFLKNNYKIFIGIIIGLLISCSIVYGINIASTSVSYTRSGSSVVNVAGALNELYQKSATSNMCIVTQAGQNNWYGMYVCDGNVGTMKSCFYGDPYNGGTLCNVVYRDYTLDSCLNAYGDTITNPSVYCNNNLPGSYPGKGNMSYTISCSC